MNGPSIGIARSPAELRMSALDPFAGPDDDRSLVDVLDRLLDRGVVVAGDIRISVADVDLLFVGLKVFLASVDTMEDARAAQIEKVRADIASRQDRKDTA